MNLREGLNLIRGHSYTEDKKVFLLTRFEPLHLKTLLQAELISQMKQNAPEVVTFGYDNLDTAFNETSGPPRFSPAILFLSWGDIHPDLEWRSRGRHIPQTQSEIEDGAKNLTNRIEAWLKNRKGLETFGIFPPLSWAVNMDSTPPKTMGPLTLFLEKTRLDIMNVFHKNGGRILTPSLGGLNFCDTIMADHPLLMEDCEALSQQLGTLLSKQTERKKAIVVDLDETLWKGVIGEDGVDQIQCQDDGHGKPYYIFQKVLKKLRNQGIFLAFCSKNNEADVIPHLKNLKFPLSFNDFSSYRCNWDKKSINIKDICRDLNIQSNSVIFIDDNPVEINEVSSNITDLTIFKTPTGANDWFALFKTLQSLTAQWDIKEEDKIRTRRPSNKFNLKENLVGKESSWNHLKSLNLSVSVNDHAFEEPRSIELINKTNQFNLTGERISGGDWAEWENKNDTFCFSAKLSDRYGEFGTIAIITGSHKNGTLSIRNMVLSCRAFGRGIEYTLLHEVIQSLGATQCTGSFKNTDKNIPARKFLDQVGAIWDSPNLWKIPLDKISTQFDQLRKESGIELKGEVKNARN
jgi:FkbH-like protein